MASEEQQARWKDSTAGIVKYLPRSDGTDDVILADAGYLNALESDKATAVKERAEADANAKAWKEEAIEQAGRKATAVKALREIADERLKGIYGLQQIAQAALDALESEAGR